MFLEISNTIIIVLEAMGCFLFFDVFQPKKVFNNARFRRAVAIAFLSVGFIALSTLLMDYFYLRQVLMVLFISVTMIFVLGYGYLQSLVLSLLFHGYLIAMEYLGFLVLKNLISDVENMSEIEEILAMNVSLLVLVVMLLCVILVRRFFRLHHNETPFRKEWIKFLIFPVFTNAVIILTTSAFNESITEYQAQALYGIGLGLVAMDYYVFFLLDDTIKVHREIKNNALFSMQKKDRMEMYSFMYKSLERQKSESHDFRNHILCIKNLADNRDYDNLRKYLDEISGSTIMTENMIDTNHVIINAILNTMYSDAASKQIAMVLKLNDLSGIKMHNDDLVVLISNLINNAIEATEKCGNNKIIYVKMEVEKDGLIFSVKNPYNHVNRKKGEDYISSKDNYLDNHGIGLKNVRKVVEKYNGTLVIKDSNGFFSVSVQIP